MKKFHTSLQNLVFKAALLSLATLLAALAPPGATYAQNSSAAPAATAEWTILSFLSADNDLEKNALYDLNEMEAAGPGPNINIIVQLDRPQFGYNDGVNSWGEAVRLKIHKDNDPVRITSPVVMKLGPNVNSGDPKTLSDFIEWGVRNYPARRYILVLWSHGSGWKTIPYDQISRAADAGSRRNVKNARNGYLNALAANPGYYYNSLAANRSATYRRAAGRSASGGEGVKKIRTGGRGFIDFDSDEWTRSISYDDTSRSSIQLNDLAAAIKRGAAAAGLTQGFDIVWFDACLMDMIEVAFELEGAARYMVASEEVTPDFGWNHVKMVNSFNKYYAVPTHEMAKLIVNKYLEAYRKKAANAPAPATREDEGEFLPVTMSALDISQARPAVAAINEFVKAACDPAYIPAIKDALAAAQRFDDADYVDFMHLLELLDNKIISKEFNGAAAALKERLKSLVMLTKTNSPNFRNARGVSVYFPMAEYSPLYDSLKFSGACDWKKLIKTYLYPQNSAVIAYQSAAIYNANGDGRLSPGENFELRVKVANVGAKEARDARFTLAVKNAAVKVASGGASCASIAPGAEAEAKFSASADGTLKIGQQVEFDVYYTPASGAQVLIARVPFTARQPFVKTANILLIQGAAEPGVTRMYADAFKARSLAFDSWCVASDGAVCHQLLDKYKNGGVVFRAVSDSSMSNKIARSELDALSGFLSTGGALVISGQDVGAMIGDTKFYQKFLKCRFNEDNGGTVNIDACGAFGSNRLTLNGAEAMNNQLFIDDIAPQAGAEPVFKYDNGRVAAVLVNDGKYRALYFAFGLEAVTGTAERAAILAKAVELLAFKMSDAVSALKADAAADEAGKNTFAALNNIELAEKSMAEDIAAANYDSTLAFCADVAKLSAGERAPFRPALRSIGEMLKAKLVQQQLSEDEAEKARAALNKIEALE